VENEPSYVKDVWIWPDKVRHFFMQCKSVANRNLTVI